MSTSAAIFKSSSDGREQVLSIDGPGSYVAELPVFDGGPYPASASAADDVTVLLVRRQAFHALCLAHPQVALKVLRVVGARLRRLVLHGSHGANSDEHEQLRTSLPGYAQP